MPTLAELLSQRARQAAEAVRTGGVPSQEAEERLRQEAAGIAQAWLGGQQGGQAQSTLASYPRTAQQIAMENAQRMAREQIQQVGTVQADEIFRREAEAQQRLDVRLDPEVNRIAEMFFNALMTRVNFEFGYRNPEWQNLGAREKILWLEATEILLDELKKEPVAKNELAVISKRRIIQ
jgi:hypothetical protein